MRDSVVFYRSFYEAIKAEPDPEKRLEAYEAIMSYALDEIEPEGLEGIPAVVFIMARPQIDANREKKKAAQKGGAPAGNKNAKKEKQPLVELENNHRLNKKQLNVNENVNENENVNVNEKDEDQPPGSYVNDFMEAYPKRTKNILTVSAAFEMEIQRTEALTGQDLITAARNYSEAVKINQTEERYIKNPDRFIKDATYIDYLPENYKKPRAAPKKKNAFNYENQREYDFAALEKESTSN